MISVSIDRVLPVYPEFMHVQWSISDPDSVVQSIDVLRSGSPNGPFEILEQNLLTNQTFYQDFDAAKHGLSKRVWYRIAVTTQVQGGDPILSEPRTVQYAEQKHRLRLARKARHDLHITLSRLNGSRFIVLKKKRFGPRCDNCYNELTQDSMLSRCGSCWGTTYEGGYFDPVEVWGKIDPQVITPQFGVQGVSENNVTGLLIQDYPEVEHEDVIVEKQTNRRFKVVRKMKTESSGIIVHQDLQVSELARDAIEYSVPVSLT